ncbi:MAG: TolC family protein, partial [Gemmataceae bacterium]|nr:TolC family protein [Gemmataceae bacterium]
MSGNRWALRVLRGLVAAALVGLVGCKQQLFLEPGDYTAAITAHVPRSIELNPHLAITPPAVAGDSPPTTVTDPERPARYLTLKECIALALEQGNVGVQSPAQFGNKSEQVASFGGQLQNQADPIRAFALDPAINYTLVERSLSKFDARWVSSMTWQKVDQPVAAQFLSFQQQRDAASLNTTLFKPLPTGGTAGITFSVDYSKFATTSTQAGFINPNYTPRLQFGFEQPLLQLFGVEINQIAPEHPRSQLVQGFQEGGVLQSGSGLGSGILVLRIRYDQSRSEFERLNQHMLVNVEAAYWNLYSAYYNKYAQEEGLRQAYEQYRFVRARVLAGAAPPQLLNQAKAQLFQFEARVITSRGQVLESERNLRGLLGLRSDDGHRLVPVDEPNLAKFTPDFYGAVNEAMALRPELMMKRQEVKIQQLNLLFRKNLRQPDFRTFGTYDVAGLGTRLDGSELIGANQGTPGNAFSSLSNNQFNSWTLGVRLSMPLGFRDANAQVREANLGLVRTYLQLRDDELRVAEQVVREYRRVDETYAVIPSLRERRKELTEYMVRVRTRIELGQFDLNEYFNYLQAQRDLATSISEEFAAIAQYNTALASFEFAKGTTLRYNNVTLADAPLPGYLGKRAADHERERTAAAIKLRERPAHDPAALSPPHPLGPAVGTAFLPPVLDHPAAPPLPGQLNLDDLPPPRPADPKGSDAPPGLLTPPGKLPTDKGPAGFTPRPAGPPAAAPNG